MPTAHRRRILPLSLAAPLVGVLCFGVGAGIYAAQQKTNDVQVVGHVLQPERAELTDERLASLELPEGWQIEVWARDVGKPRMLLIDERGRVYFSDRDAGTLSMLSDEDGDGRADGSPQLLAEREHLHGLAMHGDKFYFYTVNDVYEAPLHEDGTLGEARAIITHLPDGGQHANRTMAFGPNGMLYLSVGSTCNACDEPNPENATMLRADPHDGWKRTTFATGLRNTIGFAFHPQTQQLWGFDHGIDWLGDDEQKEEFNQLTEGARYGWPYVYADGNFNPADEPSEGSYQDWADASTEPTLLYTAHAAPMQMVFLGGDVPQDMKHDALVAMHGSWNRKPPSGHEIVRVRFDDAGQPTSIQPFITGFVSETADDGWERFARPCGLAQLPDGSILMTDDYNGAIYRISQTH